MTPERWKTIKEIFQAAVEMPVPERSAFLERACAKDVTLLPEIESLLDAYQHLAGFLEPKDRSTKELNIKQPPTS